MFFDVSNDSNYRTKNKINFKIKSSEFPENPLPKYGFDIKLNEYRNQIDKINSDVWKKVRWYINDYDFLVSEPIINRAFYKYWEIINKFDIFKNFDKENDLIFHCCEAPGGFIQGTNIYLKYDVKKEKQLKEIDQDGFISIKKKKYEKKKYKIYTISLNKELQQYKMYNLPSYNSKVINKNINITYGIDNTGNINNLQNINYIKKTLLSNNNKFYLITCDGGFDEGTDFNNKEQLHYKLILNEIYTAITLQQKNGHFILKVFDVFTQTSIHLLYLLSLMYKEIIVYKPKTSRPSNSERYIVCKYFTENDNENLIKELKTLSETLKLSSSKYISFTLFDIIPDMFIDKIKKMNEYLINSQCECLNKAIILCKDLKFIKKYDNILHESLETRLKVFNSWCKLYKLT